MSTYTILRQVVPPANCYLLEALYWRAFGRFPEMIHDDEGRDWRFSVETLDNFTPPICEPIELTDEECGYAELPQDPRMKAMDEGKSYSDLEHYDSLLSLDFEPADPTWRCKYTEERKAAAEYYREVDRWMVGFADYIDQFRIELCLKLRRGELVVYGTKLPDPNKDVAAKILDESNRWLTDLEVVQVPKESWIFETINWNESAIYGSNQSFVWIHLSVEDLLKVFPPGVLLEGKNISVIGATYALNSSPISAGSNRNKSLGRPALPWTDFHVEVARMFRDNEMPKKKEAAIAELQLWFKKTLNREVSRAAIGEKLKPYFDSLIWKGQKP
jgi:hypothetical protein